MFPSPLLILIQCLLVISSQAKKVRPLTLITKFVTPLNPDECLDAYYKSFASVAREDGIVFLDPCGADICDEAIVNGLKPCINLINSSGTKVFVTIAYEKSGNDAYDPAAAVAFWSQVQEIDGIYITAIQEINSILNSQVDDVVALISQGRTSGKQMAVYSNGIPDRAISDVADFVVVVDADIHHFFEACMPFGPGPYCRSSVTDKTASDLAYFKQSKAQSLGNIGYDSGIVQVSDFRRLVTAAEENELDFLSASFVSNWREHEFNVSYIENFYDVLGDDDCSFDRCLGRGKCFDEDGIENEIYVCMCTDDLFSGKNCQFECTCSEGSIITQQCNADNPSECSVCEEGSFANSTTSCQLCASDSLCTGGVATVCVNGTYVNQMEKTCSTCPLRHFCTAGVSEECPVGFITVETGQDRCIECVDGLCGSTSNMIIVIVSASVGGVLLIILSVLGWYCYHRYKKWKNRPRLPPNMTAEEFALKTDEDWAKEQLEDGEYSEPHEISPMVNSKGLAGTGKQSVQYSNIDMNLLNLSSAEKYESVSGQATSNYDVPNLSTNSSYASYQQSSRNNSATQSSNTNSAINYTNIPNEEDIAPGEYAEVDESLNCPQDHLETDDSQINLIYSSLLGAEN